MTFWWFCDAGSQIDNARFILLDVGVGDDWQSTEGKKEVELPQEVVVADHDLQVVLQQQKRTHEGNKYLDTIKYS